MFSFPDLHFPFQWLPLRYDKIIQQWNNNTFQKYLWCNPFMLKFKIRDSLQCRHSPLFNRKSFAAFLRLGEYMPFYNFYSKKTAPKFNVRSHATPDKDILLYWRNTNVDLKISLYVCAHLQIIQWKFRILNPKNSRVIYP